MPDVGVLWPWQSWRLPLSWIGTPQFSNPSGTTVAFDPVAITMEASNTSWTTAPTSWGSRSLVLAEGGVHTVSAKEPAQTEHAQAATVLHLNSNPHDVKNIRSQAIFNQAPITIWITDEEFTDSTRTAASGNATLEQMPKRCFIFSHGNTSNVLGTVRRRLLCVLIYICNYVALEEATYMEPLIEFTPAWLELAPPPEERASAFCSKFGTLFGCRQVSPLWPVLPQLKQVSVAFGPAPLPDLLKPPLNEFLPLELWLGFPLGPNFPPPPLLFCCPFESFPFCCCWFALAFSFSCGLPLPTIYFHWRWSIWNIP